MLIPKISQENKIPLISKTMEKRLLNKTIEMMPLMTRGARR